MAFDTFGDLWVSDSGNNRIEEFSESGAYGAQFGTSGTGNGQLKSPYGLTIDSKNNMWVADTSNNRIQLFSPSPTAGEETTPVSGTTIEYNVPLSGSGLPTMTKEEVENWAQKDNPVEAAAIFPPDEPQGWPAKDYKRATIYYLDTKGRTVNVATPSGAIATSEYNENNDTGTLLERGQPSDCFERSETSRSLTRARHAEHV